MTRSSISVCDNEQHCLLKNRVRLLIEQAGQYYSRSFPQPTVYINISGADAGQALPERNILRFNPIFLVNANTDYLEQIVAHEVAHLVAFHLFGKNIRPHGKEWAGIMKKVFGLPPIRCHNYDLSVTGRYPYVYKCNCLDKQNFFSVVRHRRACRGTIYMCRSCGDKLQYSHQLI